MVCIEMQEHRCVARLAEAAMAVTLPDAQRHGRNPYAAVARLLLHVLTFSHEAHDLPHAPIISRSMLSSPPNRMHSASLLATSRASLLPWPCTRAVRRMCHRSSASASQ